MNIVASLITLALVTTPALATDTAVSISIGQPGFYGRIDIGDAPRPVLIYDEPIVVVRSYRVVAPPIYMRVPPGHAKNWKKHCAGYDACGRRVYFVQDAWYRDVYAPHYRRHHAHKGGKGRGKS